MRKVSISIEQSRYEISIPDEDIAKNIEKIIKEDLSLERSNDMKHLINAYFKKCYEILEKDRKLEDLYNKLDMILLNKQNT